MIVTVFMFLAGINFTLHYRASVAILSLTEDDELKTYAGIVLAAIVLISLICSPILITAWGTRSGIHPFKSYQ